MRSFAAAFVTVVLYAATAMGAPGPNLVCPPGDLETFNVNGPGCSLCYAPTDCALQCLGPPVCFCEPGDTACCRNNPCCFNCPEPKPLSCETSSCSCTPETCCSTVCPAPAPAPAASTPGLALLAVGLIALGAGAVRLRARRG